MKNLSVDKKDEIAEFIKSMDSHKASQLKESDEFNRKQLIKLIKVIHKYPDFDIHIRVNVEETVPTISISIYNHNCKEISSQFFCYAFYSIETLEKMWKMLFDNLATPEKLDFDSLRPLL